MPTKQGWGFPLNANKAHYFFNGRSLCCKWGFSGELIAMCQPDMRCKACDKRLEKHKERK